MVAGGECQAGGLQRFGGALGDILLIIPGSLAFGGKAEGSWIDVLGIIDEDGALCREGGS